MRPMTMLARGIWIALALALAACAEESSLPPPIAEVPGRLEQLAVNDTAIFGIDSQDSSLIEVYLDGTIGDKLPTLGTVSEVVAYGDWVAWVETEGSGKVVRRRRNGVVESVRPLDPHIVATPEGVVYSDVGLVALWADGNPERIATPASGARVIAADLSYVYTIEADTSIVKYMRGGDTSEVVLPSSMKATIKDGQLAHRTTEGIRERDLFTGFDRVVGVPPGLYTCDLLIAGRAVMCGMYRAMDGMLDELLQDPVDGYVSVGKDVYWVTISGSDPVSKIRLADAEEMIAEED